MIDEIPIIGVTEWTVGLMLANDFFFFVVFLHWTTISSGRSLTSMFAIDP